MKVLEREIIKWGRYLFERKLISGWGGNISSRVGGGRFLITGQHAPLGFLTPRDLVEINREGRAIKKKQQPSSETPLHLAVYKGTEARTIIHVHPPAVLAFSLGHRSFVPVSFEEKYTIGEVPILAQETPTVTETEKVVEELRLHPVIILQGHGTVAVGKDLKEAFLLTDLLEEAVHCQFLKNDSSSSRTTEYPVRERGDECSELPAKAAPQSHGRKSVVRGSPAPDPLSPSFRSPGEKAYVLFSQEHMAAMTDEANSDLEFQNLGRDGGLTTSLT
ncbi:MAG: class II aldolase/adducin family protein, partial [Deltaproteobacteria bacterium]|nr:class II aldolase/adducin family protein [Deltaproteobacteria bacterium]